MGRKKRRPSKQQRYEAEKRKLLSRGLTTKKYEREVRKLAARIGI